MLDGGGGGQVPQVQYSIPLLHCYVMKNEAKRCQTQIADGHMKTDEALNGRGEATEQMERVEVNKALNRALNSTSVKTDAHSLQPSSSIRERMTHMSTKK